MTILKCPYCHYESEYGVSVCRGCKAEILYRPRIAEELIIPPMFTFFFFFLMLFPYIFLKDSILSEWGSSSRSLVNLLVFFSPVFFPVLVFSIKLYRGWRPRFFRDFRYK